MKNKTTASKPEQQPSVVEQLRAKRQEKVDDRALALKHADRLSTEIAHLDAVLSMYDSRHVPLEIEHARDTAPMLSMSSTPMLAELKQQANAAPAAETASAMPPVVVKRGKKTGKDAAGAARKPKASKSNGSAANGGDSHDAEAAAREALQKYFQPIDKLKTLERIVASNPDGLPFREISHGFAEVHSENLDLDSPIVRKVFSNRLSSILNSMSQQGIVRRTERTDATGKKENVWQYMKPAETARAEA
jgi:hypothetical protein